MSRLRAFWSLLKFCGSFHENSDKKSQKSLEMVSKKSWFCPKGLNFAFVASFRAKSQILYRNAWKGPQLRNWSSWGPNCWNGPHFPQKVSCSPFPKCVSLQYVHFLHEMCNVVNTHFLKTFGNNDLRSSKAEKPFTQKVFFRPMTSVYLESSNQDSVFASTADLLSLREAPTKLLTKAFGHCPNSFCTPPRTQPGTLGHFISEKSAPNHPGKGLDPPKQANSSQKSCPKPSGQGLRPPSPYGQCPNAFCMNLNGSSKRLGKSEERPKKKVLA